MADDDLSSALEEIRELLARRTALRTSMNTASDEFGAFYEAVERFTAVQDKLAARTPRLLAALDEVLKLTEPTGEIHYDLDGNEEKGAVRVVRCDLVREAISTALTGGTSG